MKTLAISVAVEAWPMAAPFVIARGAKTEAKVVTVTITDGNATGRGECVPYGRFGETVDSVVRQIEAWPVSDDRDALKFALPAGAARNAIDCALWDLAGKRQHRPVCELVGIPPLSAVTTAYTLSLASTDAMAAAARAACDLNLLKIKLGGDADDDARMRAVRDARPDARLIGDANEAWTDDNIATHLALAAELDIELIEQPLPEDHDQILSHIARPVAVCADESVHTSDDLSKLADRYDAVNIKLDKAGGLTEALAMLRESRALGFKIMVGSMVATSLAVAPALYIAQTADWIDLDGPLLLDRDRDFALKIEMGRIAPPSRELWG